MRRKFCTLASGIACAIWSAGAAAENYIVIRHEAINRCLPTCIIVAGMVAWFAVLPARADLGDELFKLIPSDPAVGDWFGESVAISGDTAIVGALRKSDDDGNFGTGSAYLFEVTTGDELFKLTASDAAEEDFFGGAVAISGNTAMVGAFTDGDGANSGSAYLFDVSTGDELFKLTASDAATGDFFGISVAISGNIAIVGSPGDSDDGEDSGSVYLFDATTGDELRKLTASDAAAEDQFGWSVAISGNTAIVGSNMDDDDGVSSGSAYLFDVTTGDELFKLTASDAAAEDQFGVSVAISGNVVTVGSPFDDDDGLSSGSAYLFDVTTGDELFKLTASDAAAEDQFGVSVAISGNVVTVGSPFDDDDGEFSGSAYMFDATTGAELAKLTASDAAAEDQFGISVAINGGIAIVGAYLDDNAGRFSQSGSAYLFSVPEPASSALAAMAAMALSAGLLSRPRRRRGLRSGQSISLSSPAVFPAGHSTDSTIDSNRGADDVNAV